MMLCLNPKKKGKLDRLARCRQYIDTSIWSISRAYSSDIETHLVKAVSYEQLKIFRAELIDIARIFSQQAQRCRCRWYYIDPGLSRDLSGSDHVRQLEFGKARNSGTSSSRGANWV